MRFGFPVALEVAEDGVTATFPDVPEAVTFGATPEEAIVRAEDALVSALAVYVEEGRVLPRPSPAQGRPVVAPPPLEAAKLALYEAMRAAGASPAALAQRLATSAEVVARLVDPLQPCRIEEVDRALRALDRRLIVELEPG